MRTKVDMKLWLLASAAAFVLLSLAAYFSRLVSFPYAYWQSAVSAAEVSMFSRVLMYLGRLIFSLAFTYIYAKGYENRPWLGEGIRYGMCMVFLLSVPTFLYSMVTSTIPTGDLTGVLVWNIVQVLLCGLLVALIYRTKSGQAAV